MKSIPKGIWEFSILLLLLLILAAGASWSTISFIQSLIPDEFKRTAPPNIETVHNIITVAILALTMGFLFLAGALGLWAIRSTSERESRRRIGRFVDAMDYLQDGLIALDRRGRITGSNPSARALMREPTRRPADLQAVFPSLTGEDIEKLLNGVSPEEVERACPSSLGPRALRFRSQPAEDVHLVLVSDVTDRRNVEMLNRQVAQLQLIGRIAGGVAHDFNNILCAISAHAALIERGRAVTADEKMSLDAIALESQRGAELANHLLELSRTGVKGDPCERVAEHIEKAAAILRVGLSTRWEVRVRLQDEFKPLPLTPVQIEQVLVNLSLLVADEFGKNGLLRIHAGKPQSDILFDTDETAEVVLIITAHADESSMDQDTFIPHSRDALPDPGVIPSVVRTMIEEVGGTMEILEGPHHRHGYRIAIPSLPGAFQKDAALANIPEAWRARLNSWHMLIALSGGRDARLVAHLRELGIKVQETDNLVTALQQVQGERALNGIVLDKPLLGTDARPLLRAIMKLQPNASLVLLSETDENELQSLQENLIVLQAPALPETIVQALLHAKDPSSG